MRQGLILTEHNGEKFFFGNVEYKCAYSLLKYYSQSFVMRMLTITDLTDLQLKNLF